MEKKHVMDVTYVSVWDHEEEVRTNAKFDWESGKMEAVEVSDQVVEGICTREYIIFPDGTELDIDQDHYMEHGELMVQNEVVLSSDSSERGYIIGEDEETDCEVESCTGTNYIVYWKDGEKTVCCGKGLKAKEENVYQTL